MKSKNIFLDLDGTLLDIEGRYVNLFDYMCRNFQIKKLSSSEFWELKRSGKSNIQILSQFGYEKKLSDNFHNKWVGLVEEIFWLRYDNLQFDTVSFLNWLTKKEFKIFLLTGRNNRKNLIQQLKELRILHFFNSIFNVDTSEMVTQKKLILKEHKPKFFIGDSEFDYLACKNTGVEFYCVSNGFRNKKFLEEKNVPNINANLEEVMKNL